MEIHGADRFATTPSFPPGAARHPQVDRHNFLQPRHHPNFNGEQNDSNGYYFNSNPNPPPQNRQFPHPTNAFVNGGFVKLYVVGIPRDATEQDVASVFGEYGEIIEIVLVKDKCTGIQQEYCFVKYGNIEQANRAIGALHTQYTFPGAMTSIRVNYAGANGVQIHKLYVGCVGKQATTKEIEEIFSPFGVLEDVFVVQDELKQNRGFAFVQFSCIDMAYAAIQALNGAVVMRGCDQPLMVRFAEPKKPRVRNSRPTPYPNGPSNGHVVSNETKQTKNTTPTGCKTTPMTSQSLKSIAEMQNSIECDWSEHVSPDGELYYYNCTTCESRWEKPVEYAIYEQELDYLEDKLQLQLQRESKLENLSSPEVSEAQKL